MLMATGATLATGCPSVAAARAPSRRASAGPHSVVSRARRLPISPHGRPLVPATGDWEGTANGFPASFELVYRPAFRIFGRPPYGYVDLTTIEPASCPVSTSRYSEGVIGEQPDVTPLGSGGTFGLPLYHLLGRIRSATVAGLSTSFNSDPEHGSTACRGTLTWMMHPADRRRVDDGSWSLRFASGETGGIVVKAGGRLAVGFQFPLSLGQCGGAFGGADLFIPASDEALFGEVGGPSVSLKFTSATAAVGQVSDATLECGNYTQPFTAALSKLGQ